MKKFLLILLLIVVGVIGFFSFLFYQTIDERSYQQQIVNSAQELLGRKLQVNGELSIKLFPSPVITLTDISILNPQEFKNKNLIHIEKVEAHVQLSSLFKNPLVVQNIVLIKPHIFLEKNEKGRINWDFAFFKPNSHKINQDNLLGQRTQDMPPQFQNIEIKEGSVVYLNQLMHSNLSFSDVTGELKSDTIRGPFDFKGQVKIDKMPLETTLHIDKIGADVETKFSIALSAPNSKATFSIQNGKVARFAEVTQEASGSFTLSIPQLSTFLVDLNGYKELPMELNKQITGGGQFLLTAKQASLDDVAFIYGNVDTDIAASGKITFTYPENEKDKEKTDVLLRFSQLNLDMLKAYTMKRSHLSGLFTLLPRILPNNIDFFVASEKLTLNAGTVSKVSLKGRYRNNIMSIFDFSAILPEKVDLSVKGEIFTDEKKPNAKLSLSLNGRNLDTVFSWAKIDTPFVKNPAALYDTSVSTQLEMTPENLTFSKINAKVAQGQVTGSLSFSLTAPELTAFADLNIKSLNFDNFVPYQSNMKKQSAKQALEALKNYLETSVLFSNADVQFNLTANDVTFKNLPIQKLTFKGLIKDREWSTETLEIKQMATADIRYSGTMRKDANGNLVFDNANINFDVPKASIFFDRLKVDTPLNSTIGKLNINAVLNGTFNQLDVSGQMSVSQGKIQVEGNVKDVLLDVSPYQMKTKINFPGMTQFVRLFQPTYKGHPNLTGTFNFEGLISSGLDTLSFKDASLAVGPQKANFDLDFKRDDTILKVTGKVSSPRLYMDKFVVDDTASSNTSYSKDLLDFSSLDNLQLDVLLSAQKASWENFETNDFESHILLDQKILQIEGTKAKIGDGKISFNSNLNFSASTPLLKGKFEVEGVPLKPDLLSLGSLRLKSGKATFAVDFNAKGNSVDDMLRSLSATGSFDVNKGIVSGMNLLSFERRSQAMVVRTDIVGNMTNTLQKEFFAGETAFEDFAGTYAITNGLLRTTDTVFKAQNANALMQGEWNIPQKNISASAAISFNNLAGYPPVSLSFKGSTRNLQTYVDLTSFVKYIEASASDTRNEQIRVQREEEARKREIEYADRVQRIAVLTQEAEGQIEQAKKALRLASSETAESQLVRANDAFILLQELSNLSTPSEADAAKASLHASQIASRTKDVLKEVNDTAGSTLRERISKDITSAQKQLDAITRIYQRLGNVEIVNQAYQKASASFAQMKQMNARTLSDQTLDSLEAAAERIAQEADVIDLTYQSIAKYDIESDQVPYYNQQPYSMQGSIRRN